MSLPQFFRWYVASICLVAMIFTSLDANALGFSRLTVEMVRDRKTRLSKAENFDDKQEELRFKVKLTNADTKADMEGLQVKVWIFGESVTQRNYLKVFSIDDKTITLQARKSEEFMTTSVSYVYDNTNTAQYGIKYGGWVILVRDAAGVMVAQKASADRFLRNLEKLDALQVNGFCDREFNPVQAVIY